MKTTAVVDVSEIATKLNTFHYGWLNILSLEELVGIYFHPYHSKDVFNDIVIDSVANIKGSAFAEANSADIYMYTTFFMNDLRRHLTHFFGEDVSRLCYICTRADLLQFYYCAERKRK